MCLSFLFGYLWPTGCCTPSGSRILTSALVDTRNVSLPWASPTEINGKNELEMNCSFFNYKVYRYFGTESWLLE